MTRSHKDNGYTAIKVEGGILPPEFLQTIAASKALYQSQTDYGLTKSFSVKDEIGRAWRTASDLWDDFRTNRKRTDLPLDRTCVRQFLEPLLTRVFCFGDLTALRDGKTIGERRYPFSHEAAGGAVPILLTTPDHDLGKNAPAFGDGNRRRSPHELIQEYLNAEDASLWAIVSNGSHIRMLRDNPSLTRPAYLEADLERIFEEQLYPDFALMWLTFHATRFRPEGADPKACILEAWRKTAVEKGERAREKLQGGVTEALKTLGQGFLTHPENEALRRDIREGRYTKEEMHQELLRLIYRLLFLFTAEDRGLLHDPASPTEAQELYAEGYSLSRLRDRSRRRRYHDRYADMWAGLKLVFGCLARGEPALGLPALGGLFGTGHCPRLDAAELSNEALMSAILSIGFFRSDKVLQRVNYKDMDTEELGSVYESLLELHPVIDVDVAPWQFGYAELSGNDRKTSGSYYTPPALVEELIKSALLPVIAKTVVDNPTDPTTALLALNVIDPACGSGHFLLAAARRLAAELARLRAGADQPDEEVRRHALREVVRHCIYGVDRNPLAVELCRTALWIEAIEPGKPLTFLDARIRCGDSLVGVTDVEMLRKGLPDEAFKALTGDTKDVVKVYAKQNKIQREGQSSTGLLAQLLLPTELADSSRLLTDMPENTLTDIADKNAAFKRLHAETTWKRLKTACDLYIAAFFMPKTGNAPTAVEVARGTIPVTDHVWTAARGELVPVAMAEAAREISERIAAFHWMLEFPHVFARGGFDVVLGNPPWERIKLQEQEFFASRSQAIAKAQNKAAREVLIKALAKAEPGTPDALLLEDFVFAKREAEACSEFVRNSGRFPLTGSGDVNTYALFAELFVRLARSLGRIGIIVPTGIATDSSTSAFFGSLIENTSLISLFDFQTGQGFFDRIGHARFKFCLLTVTGLGGSQAAPVAFGSFLRRESDMTQKERFFTLSAKSVMKLNPNTKTAPIFRTRYDAELTAAIYDRVPILIEDMDPPRNPWRIAFQRMFDMSNDSSLFMTPNEMAANDWICDKNVWVRETSPQVEYMVPLYEAKMIHHFDHRWATYPVGAVGDDSACDVTSEEKQTASFEPTPRYWVPGTEVHLRASRVPSSLKRAWREANSDRCLRVMAEWLTGWSINMNGHPLREAELFDILGRDRGWRSIFGKSPSIWLLESKTKAIGFESQLDTPLDTDDVLFIKSGRPEPLDLVSDIIARKQPRWLMGWRDITNATNERTVVASVFPKVGTGDTLLLKYSNQQNQNLSAILNAIMCSMVLDYICRQKIGGSHLKYNVFKQNAVLPPDVFQIGDINFAIPRVLELTYTSNSMRPWAEDMGFCGQPFSWDEDRRALLRAELDAYFAMKYGLTRDELRYVLDPAAVMGPDFPSETFRGLKYNEERRYGEYRTQRLVLEAWDRFTTDGTFARLSSTPALVTA